MILTIAAKGFDPIRIDKGLPTSLTPQILMDRDEGDFPNFDVVSFNMLIY